MNKTIITLGSLLLAGSLSAQWQVIDDMESYTVDTELDTDVTNVGTGVWNFYRSADDQYSVLPFFGVRTDPFGDAVQGKVLELDPGVPSDLGQGNTTLERALPEGQQIVDNFANPNKSTFYFKYARPIVEGVPAQSDTTWGMVSEAARDTTTGIFAYGSYSVLGRTEIDGIIDIRDGSTYANLTAAALNTEVWYEIWFVVDHSNNTFTQYIKGGTDFPELTQLPFTITVDDMPVNKTEAAYRFATFANLDSLLFVTTTGTQAALKGQDPVYFDDFYIDVNAENLTSPTGDGGGGGGAATGGKFINISTRGTVGTGDDVLIGGFVIGEDAQQVVIQAIGQELAGVTGFLVDPVLSIRNSEGVEIGMNDNWQDSQEQLITDLWGGNPPFAEGSLSAGGVWTLDPGSYTAIISGKDNTTGVALIEVYQID